MKTLFSLALALHVGILLGCYSTLDSFSNRLARLVCVNTRECARADFDAEYDSLSECTDDTSRDLRLAFGGCFYDETLGRECIHGIYRRRKDCDLFVVDIPTECEGILYCTRDALDDAARARPISTAWITEVDEVPEAFVAVDE